jgi:hypothetical protein
MLLFPTFNHERQRRDRVGQCKDTARQQQWVHSLLVDGKFDLTASSPSSPRDGMDGHHCVSPGHNLSLQLEVPMQLVFFAYARACQLRRRTWTFRRLHNTIDTRGRDPSMACLLWRCLDKQVAGLKVIFSEPRRMICSWHGRGRYSPLLVMILYSVPRFLLNATTTISPGSSCSFMGFHGVVSQPQAQARLN